MDSVLSTVLVHGLIYGALFSVVETILIVWSIWVNPEMWLHDAPQEIQRKHGPMSARAKRQRILFAIPVFGAALALPSLALYQLPVAYSFQALFTTLFVMFMVFNVVDLVLIDWLIVEAWRPGFIRNTPLGQLMEKRYYLFHFIGFCKGSVGLTLVSLLVAGVVVLVR